MNYTHTQNYINHLCVTNWLPQQTLTRITNKNNKRNVFLSTFFSLFQSNVLASFKTYVFLLLYICYILFFYGLSSFSALRKSHFRALLNIWSISLLSHNSFCFVLSYNPDKCVIWEMSSPRATLMVKVFHFLPFRSFHSFGSVQKIEETDQFRSLAQTQQHKFTDKSFLCCCCKSFHIKFEFDFECEVFKRFESAYLMETDSIFSHLIDDRPTMDTDNEMEWMMKIKQTLLNFLRYSNCRCWCCFYRKSQRKQYLPIQLKIH